jgi:hypothetical protein
MIVDWRLMIDDLNENYGASLVAWQSCKILENEPGSTDKA